MIKDRDGGDSAEYMERQLREGGAMLCSECTLSSLNKSVIVTELPSLFKSTHSLRLQYQDNAVKEA